MKFETVLITEVILILAIIGICIVKVKRYKNKKIELTDKQKKKFTKLSGFLMIYLLIIIYNIILRAILITTAIDISDVWTRRIVIIQSLINLGILIWISIIIFKKKKEAPNQIQKIIFGIGIFNFVTTIIQIIYTVCATQLQDSNDYYIQATNTMTSIILYTIIWTTYFKISKRVSRYFTS